MKDVRGMSNVIKINDRYFYKFGKGNRVMTARCLSGAATYQDHNVSEIFDKLVGLGKKPVIVKIGEVAEPVIVQVADEIHQHDIDLLHVDIATIKDCLKRGLTLEDYLKSQDEKLTRYSTPIEFSEEFSDEIPF